MDVQLKPSPSSSSSCPAHYSQRSHSPCLHERRTTILTCRYTERKQGHPRNLFTETPNWRAKISSATLNNVSMAYICFQLLCFRANSYSFCWKNCPIIKTLGERKFKKGNLQGVPSCALASNFATLAYSGVFLILIVVSLALRVGPGNPRIVQIGEFVGVGRHYRF